jgi:hypothetical protein
MGRGTELAEGIRIDEGMSPAGVRSIIHFQGTEVIFQRQQDMEPVLRYVQEMRERNEGKPWGTGKEVGHVPELFMDQLRPLRGEERRKWLRGFFRANPMLCAYPAFCK